MCRNLCKESHYLPYHMTEKQYACPITFKRCPKTFQSSTTFQSFGNKSYDICKFFGNRRKFSSDVRNTSEDRVTFANCWGSSEINFRAAVILRNTEWPSSVSGDLRLSSDNPCSRFTCLYTIKWECGNVFQSYDKFEMV